MMEQILQTALDFLKEVWFQLNSRFELENTETFKFFKPYLIQIQDNPMYIGISLVVFFLIPYGLIKFRNIAKMRERKLDELMEEMEEEEEYDEDDPRRLRRPAPEPVESIEKPLYQNEEDTDATPHMKVLENLGEQNKKYSDEQFELEPSDIKPGLAEIKTPKENSEPISSQLTESEFDKELNEFMEEETNLKVNPDIAAKLDLDDSSHDQVIKEHQGEGELMELDSSIPEDDPFPNYSDLGEKEQDQAIKELQDEMGRTISQLTKKMEEPDDPSNSTKDINKIHISGEDTIEEGYSHEQEEEEFFPEETPTTSPETESAADSPISEQPDSEILAALEPELETGDPERDVLPESIQFGADLSSESFTFEPKSTDLEETREPKFNTESPLEPKNQYSTQGQSDSLIERLKFLQARFENRYQPLERDQLETPTEKKVPEYPEENFTEPKLYKSATVGVSPGSKKYMELLESFIFMKDQKKHK